MQLHYLLYSYCVHGWRWVYVAVLHVVAILCAWVEVGLCSCIICCIAIVCTGESGFMQLYCNNYVVYFVLVYVPVLCVMQLHYMLYTVYMVEVDLCSCVVCCILAS